MPQPSASNPRIFISAGEASGDAYGAALITALRAQLPTASFTGLGGVQMQASGQQRIVRAEDVAHMGITEVIQHAPFIYRQYRKLVASIKQQRPDVAILIDFPDVNFRLAKHLKRFGVPVVWFVSPQLWAWKRGRLRWVQERVDKMLVIFPFEETFYRNRGVDATFVGHPLAAAALQTSAADVARRRVLDDIHIVVQAAKRPGHAPQKAVLGAIEPWIVDAARERGHDLSGYNHVIDGSAVRHMLNNHADRATEERRGQAAVTTSDFGMVPLVVHSPDRLIFNTRNRLGRDQIGYVKRMPDSISLYFEEIRRGKAELAAVTMRKFPATMDADRIAASLHPNVRDDGSVPIVVHGPDAAIVSLPQLESREEYAAQHSLDPTRTWIALLPGSRWKEIRANLPTLHELAITDLFSASAAYTTFDGDTTTAPGDPSMHTRYEFLLPIASTIDRAALNRYLAELDAEHLRYFGATENDPNLPRPRVTLVSGPDAAREALHHARASVVASGTATVLAAVVGNPFVVVYRVSALTFALAKRLVEYPPELPPMLDADWNPPVGMVNLIAGRRIVPELLQQRFTAENVAAALTPLLAETPERATQIADLAEVRERLHSDISPIDHAVAAVLDLLRPA